MGRFDQAPVDRAAGGIVLRSNPVDGTVNVLVVHRPRFDDWVVPKGHVDDGESWAETALREVHEETGSRARIVGDPTSVAYVLPRNARDDDGESGVPTVKVVVFYPMAVVDTDAEPDPPDAHEVDLVEWWSLDRCERQLTYDDERRVVRYFASPT